MGKLFPPPDDTLAGYASIGVVVAVIVVSLGVHEAAHAWVAYKRGDSTARDLGRVTLNPLVHIDLFLTIVLPILLAFTVGFIFGGAKPVPVNFHQLRRPYRDMALVALAGPISNLLIAAVLIVAQKLLVSTFGVWDKGEQGPLILTACIGFNLILAALNMIPIPPLDGSRVMTWLLPREMRGPYMQFGRFGIFIVMVLLFIGVLRGPMIATMNAMFDVLWAVLSLGGTW